MNEKEYKPAMLTTKAYSALQEAKNLMMAGSRRRTTLSDVIDEYVRKRLIFQKLKPELKDYINKFISESSRDGNLKGAILFGSVAKGTYNKFSDVDILLIVDDNKFHFYKTTFKKAAIFADDMNDALIKNGLYMRISPLIVSLKDIKEFTPIFLDILDYGITLFERENVATEFIYSLRKIRHKRIIRQGMEVLEWE